YTHTPSQGHTHTHTQTHTDSKSFTLCALQNVYSLLELFGKVTAISIVSSSVSEDTESVKAPSLCSDSCSEGEDDSTPVRKRGIQREREREVGAEGKNSTRSVIPHFALHY